MKKPEPQKQFVTVISYDTSGGLNLLFGDKLTIPSEVKTGEDIHVRLGGRISFHILVNNFLLALGEFKRRIVENPEIPEEEKVLAEQEVYDLINVSVGTFLDSGFPRINAQAALTEEACAQYKIDPKTATAQELLDAENKFIEEFPERAAQCRELQPAAPIKLPENPEHKGPNREQRRAQAKKSGGKK